MKTGNVLKRALTFMVGLLVLAFGVALSVKADLGVSPVSCVPYVYSLSSSLSLGQLTILINALFVVMQMVLLRRKYQWFQLIQLPAVMLFGGFIDLAMRLVSGLQVVGYGWQIGWCLLSCVIVAFGVFLEVKSGLTYLPAEGLAAAITDTFRHEFGAVKVGIDSSLVIFGILSSFVFLHQLQGIREGTIVAALLIGFFVRFYAAKLPMLESWLGKGSKPVTVSARCPE